MMLQWLLQETVSSFLFHPCHPTILPFHLSQECSLPSNAIYHIKEENTKGEC